MHFSFKVDPDPFNCIALGSALSAGFLAAPEVVGPLADGLGAVAAQCGLLSSSKLRLGR